MDNLFIAICFIAAYGLILVFYKILEHLMKIYYILESWDDARKYEQKLKKSRMDDL